MLRVNVGMSRKLTRDFQSTGFSVNLESEICVDLNDPETAIEKIREVYDLADEALRDQIERYESDSAIASRDEPPKQIENQPTNGSSRPDENSRIGNSNSNSIGYPRNGNSRQTNQSGGSNQATNKQIQFLLNLGKQQGLSKPQLENRIADILGKQVTIYDLSKSDAGTILDQMTANNANRSSHN